MKIDNAVKPPGGGATGVRKDGGKPSVSPQVVEQGSGVELSTLSTRLQEIESNLASSPVADNARVSEIRQAISQGTFKIDTGKIADGLLDSVRQMLASQK